MLADQRSAPADQMLSTFLAGGRKQPQLYYSGIGHALTGALLCMLASTRAAIEEVDLLREELKPLLALVQEGNLEGYYALDRKLNVLRRKSQQAINALSSQRKELETEISSLEARKDVVWALSVGLNLLGLVIVMLKDLPVWKTASAKTS